MPYLVFIDTNIYLDFYRYGNDVSLSLLERINNNHERIITTAEVEMEYKKNRQEVILKAISTIKPQKFGELNIPSFLKESQHKKTATRRMKELNDSLNKIIDRTEKLLESPGLYDPVYRILQRLFKAKRECHLNRGKKMRSDIREKAQKRYLLGYPPRKPSDTSIGDAINWEWIIYCAKVSHSDIVIISRDEDYGKHYKNKSYLNDWLYQEFKERISTRRSIILTRRLSEGYRLAGIGVSKAEEQAEESFLSSYITTYNDTFLSLDALRNIGGIYDSDVLRSALSGITLNSDTLKSALSGIVLNSDALKSALSGISLSSDALRTAISGISLSPDAWRSAFSGINIPSDTNSQIVKENSLSSEDNEAKQDDESHKNNSDSSAN